MASDGQASLRERHNLYQRWYYEGRYKPNMQPRRSPYVERQVDRVLALPGFDPSRPLLEIGAGLGRHTLPLLDRGCTVTALDLSPIMLRRLEERAASERLTTVACDLAEAPRHLEARFTQAVGFFTLHHMHDLEAIFAGLGGLLLPGARVAFLEPNAWNPLYYVQIVVTPGMTWRGDGGVVRMRRGPVLGAMARAGFSDLALSRFGLFPSFVTDRRWGARLEDLLETLPLPVPLRAFQIFSGTWPGAGGPR